MSEHNTIGPRSQPEDSPDSPGLAESSDGSGAAGECEYAPRISAYHDGEVPQAEARELARHVAACPACAAQLAFSGRVSRRFDAEPAPHLAEDARQRLAALINEFQADQPQRPRIKPPADVRWVRRLAAVAAVLFVVATGKVIYQQKIAGHGTPGGTLIKNDGPVAPAPGGVSGTGSTPANVTNARFDTGTTRPATAPH